MPCGGLDNSRWCARPPYYDLADGLWRAHPPHGAPADGRQRTHPPRGMPVRANNPPPTAREPELCTPPKTAGTPIGAKTRSDRLSGTQQPAIGTKHPIRESPAARDNPLCGCTTRHLVHARAALLHGTLIAQAHQSARRQETADGSAGGMTGADGRQCRTNANHRRRGAGRLTDNETARPRIMTRTGHMPRGLRSP